MTLSIITTKSERRDQLERIIIDTLWTRKTRNDINENFEYLFEGVGTVNKTITDLIVEAGDANPEVIQARGGETVLNDRLNEADNAFNDHKNSEDNPHLVTKEQIGLSEVTNERQATRSEFNGFKVEISDQLDTFEGEFNQFADDFSDQFNDYVSDNAFKGVMLTLSGGKTVETSTWTTVTWNNAEYNLSNFWSSSSRPTRITIPKGVKKVRLSTNTLWDSNSDGSRRIRMRKNGEYTTGLSYISYPAGGTSPVGGTSSVVNVFEGDYFEMEVYQSSGSDRELREDPYTWFSLEVVDYSKK